MVLLNIYDLYDLPPVNVIDTVLYIFIVVTVLLLAYYFKGCSWLIADSLSWFTVIATWQREKFLMEYLLLYQLEKVWLLLEPVAVVWI